MNGYGDLMHASFQRYVDTVVIANSQARSSARSAAECARASWSPKGVAGVVDTGARERGSIDARVHDTAQVNSERLSWRIAPAVSGCGLEDFNDAQGLSAGAALQPQRWWCLVARFVIVCVDGRLYVEACARFGEIVGALAVGEQCVMSDAMESMW
jgi:hypothetical protein